MHTALKETIDKGRFASVYTDAYNTANFMFGKALYVDEDWFVMYLIAPNGDFDGIFLQSVADIFRIELGSNYEKRMQVLMQSSSLPEVDIEFGENALLSLLKYAQRHKQLVSVELLDSGEWDIIGKIDSLSQNNCILKAFTTDGIEDGVSHIKIADITKISFGSQEEELIQRLINFNQVSVQP